MRTTSDINHDTQLVLSAYKDAENILEQAEDDIENGIDQNINLGEQIKTTTAINLAGEDGASSTSSSFSTEEDSSITTNREPFIEGAAAFQQLTAQEDADNQLAQLEQDDLPDGVDVDTALDYLAHCHTFPCIKKAHTYLAGRTRFNFPHYFLTGWQKCATTSVNAYLRHHPQYLPGLLKESHWFSQCQVNSSAKNCHAMSTSHYMREFLRLEDAAAGGLEHVTFDASVDYARKGETLASELYTLFPWLKIVLILREPISRVISYSRMYTERKHGEKGCFDGSPLYDCLQPFFQPGNPRTAHYDDAMEGWLKYFPAKQIKVIQFEELQQDPNRILYDLKLFLDMDPSLPDIVLQNLNNRKKGGFPMELRQYEELVLAARPHAERLAQLLDDAGLADKEEWMARWKFVWNRQMTEDCDDQGQCLVNSN